MKHAWVPKNKIVCVSVKASPAEGGDAFTEKRLMPALWVSTDLLHVNIAGLPPAMRHMMACKRREFRCLGGFGGVRGGGGEEGSRKGRGEGSRRFHKKNTDNFVLCLPRRRLTFGKVSAPSD